MKIILSLTAAAAVALALGACGSGGGGTATASDANARDTARLKLQQCLKDSGVELPRAGANGGQNGGAGIRQLSTAQRNKLQQAMRGPCAKYRNAAFGNITPQQRQQFQDAFAKFSDCMRRHGVDIPNFTPGQGPPTGARRINQNDPTVKAARQACQSNLPNGGRFGGGPGGPEPAQ